MTTQSLSGFSAELLDISKARGDLEQDISKAEIKSGPSMMEDLFSRSTNLLERTNALTSDYPQSLDVQKLQALVQNTNKFVLSAIERFCSRETYNAEDDLGSECLPIGELPMEMIGLVAKNLNVDGFLICVRVSKLWNRVITTLLLTTKELMAIRLPKFTIIDAEKIGLKLSAEPPINSFSVLKCVKYMTSKVEENEGMTLLTMLKGTTLNQLVQIASENGIEVKIAPKISENIGDVAVEDTYRILISNNVISGTRLSNCEAQGRLLEEMHCQMPSVQEALALCIFTRIIFNRSVYRSADRKKGIPATFCITSTQIGKHRLSVGNSRVCQIFIRRGWSSGQELGAGSKMKFISESNG